MFITMISRSRPRFLAGLDSMVHISEEAKNANVAIPYAIVFATVSSVALGWGQSVLYFVCRAVLKDISKASTWPWPFAWDRIYRTSLIIPSDNRWLQLSDANASTFSNLPLTR